MASVYLMLAFVEKSLSQVVIGLPLGLVPCWRTIIIQFPIMPVESQSQDESVKEDGHCAGLVKHLASDMFRLRDAQHSSVALSFNDVYHNSSLTKLIPCFCESSFFLHILCRCPKARLTIISTLLFTSLVVISSMVFPFSLKLAPM